jgi:AcrR family transcriptional regulator
MSETTPPAPTNPPNDVSADWHRRVVDRSLRSATQKSIDRGASLIRAASILLERSNGSGFTVQEVADEAGQSLRTLYQYFESKDDLMLAVYEEAMRTYARMIREAIAKLSVPLERLGGAIIAAARMPERSKSGFDVGLARLRNEVGAAQPGLVARSQEPVTSLFAELLAAAIAAGDLPDGNEQQAVYIITALNSSYIHSLTLGNEYGLELPKPIRLAAFCLRGLGADLGDDWYVRVGELIELPEGPLSSASV